MSAQYFEIHIAPSDDAAARQIAELESRLAAMDEFESMISNVEVDRESDAHIVVSLDASTFIDPDELLDVIRGIGVSQMETQVFNSQVGEYSFFKDSEYFAEYADGAWQWLADPNEEEDEGSKLDPSTLPAPYRSVAQLWLKDPVAAIQSLTLDSIAGQSFADLMANIPRRRGIYWGAHPDPGIGLSAFEEMKGLPELGTGLDWYEAKTPGLDRAVVEAHMASLGAEKYRDDDEQVGWKWETGAFSPGLHFSNRIKSGLHNGECFLNVYLTAMFKQS